MKTWIKSLHALALLPLVALAVSCASSKAPPPQVLQPWEYDGPIRIACVGDSITYGSGVKGRETNSYPAVMGRLLGNQFVVKNFGVSGATLLKRGDKPYWNLPQFDAISTFAPSAVIIKLGTNDSKPQNWQYGAEFAGDLKAMIDHFRALPSRPKIWLCLPVPVYQTRWGINEEVVKGQIIPVIELVADEKQVPLIDLYDALTDHPEMFPDKIHPNAEGARLMAEVIAGGLTTVPK